MLDFPDQSLMDAQALKIATRSGSNPGLDSEMSLEQAEPHIWVLLRSSELSGPAEFAKQVYIKAERGSCLWKDRSRPTGFGPWEFRPAAPVCARDVDVRAV